MQGEVTHRGLFPPSAEGTLALLTVGTCHSSAGTCHSRAGTCHIKQGFLLGEAERGRSCGRRRKAAPAQIQGASNRFPCWHWATADRWKQSWFETQFRVTSWVCHQSAVPWLPSYPLFTHLFHFDCSIFHIPSHPFRLQHFSHLLRAHPPSEPARL